jgi:hypothetical protein
MTHEAPVAVPVAIEYNQAILAPGIEAPAPPLPQPPPDSKEAQAVEAVFAAQEQESEKVLGLLGMWTGTLLLHDLAVETFSGPADEEDEELVELRKNKDKNKKN